MTRILIAGATGLVGAQVLKLALTDRRVSEVIAPTRVPMLASHAKLTNRVVDMTKLPADASWWVVDGVVCTIGTTREKADRPRRSAKSTLICSAPSRSTRMRTAPSGWR